jgi:glycerate kinase
MRCTGGAGGGRRPGDTGEGRIDSQTIHGKVPVGVAKVAQRYNVPVIAIAGSLTADVGLFISTGWMRYSA